MQPSPRRRALTLVEVMLASTVLAVLVIPMMGIFRMGNRFSVAGERELQATLFAHEMIERMRAEMDRWTQRSDRMVGIPSVRLSPPERCIYNLERKEIAEGLEELAVVVKWKEGKVNREARLSTLVSRQGNLRKVRSRPSGFLRRQRSRLRRGSR